MLWKVYLTGWFQKFGWMILSTKFHGMMLATWALYEGKIQGNDFMKILIAYFACNIGVKFFKNWKATENKDDTTIK